MCDRICKTCGGDDAVAKIAEAMGFRPDVAFLKVMKISEALRWALDYIDAIPTESADNFPAMPGFDRDYVENLLGD